MTKFKVLRGQHSEQGKIYKKGDTVDSKTDLAERFNFPGSIKFAKIASKNSPSDEVEEEEEEETAEETYSAEELSLLTIPDLKELANDQEINLSGLSRKEEIIEAILGNTT